jgi:glycosyltransferase involved in cell wall biosynthesis
MKIAIIGTAFPYRGGLANFNERLACQIQEEGHQVNIYTFTLQYPNFIFPGKSQFSKDMPPKNLNIKRALNSLSPINWLRTGNRIKKEKYDLVIIGYWLPFMSPCLSTVANKIKSNKKSKIVSIVHNMIPHESRMGDKFLSNLFVKNCHAFLALSDSVLKDIEQFDSLKPKVVSPHPVYDNFGESVSKEAALKKLNLESKYKYILFFGLIRDYKGLDLLLNAMPLIDNKNVKLIIAGEYYSNKEFYSDLIEKNNLKDKIIDVDRFVDHRDVRYYFCASDLVVQPYKSATQSGVTQIAYHFNKPMVVTNVGGLKEMCPDKKVGYLVEPNKEQVAQGVNRFFAQTDVTHMTKNIIEEKKKYSWNKLTKEIYLLANKC